MFKTRSKNFVGGGERGTNVWLAAIWREKAGFSSVSEYFYNRLYYVFRLFKLPYILKKNFSNFVIHFLSFDITIHYSITH